jgi:cytochrome c556
MAAWCAVALSAQGGAPAQANPPEMYVQAMKEIQAAAQAVNQIPKTQDFKAASQAAAKARTAFLYVQGFWTERKATDAAELAAAGAKAAGDIVVAADLSSTEGVDYSAKEMNATCMACHTAHRERKDDGTFTIK